MTEQPTNTVRGKLSGEEVGILLEQLSAGVSEQQPLDEVFLALSEDLAQPRLRRIAQHLAAELATGADLGAATASIKHVFPAHMQSALAIGAKTGNLNGVLIGLSESEFVRRRMRRELRSALAYPMLVVGFTAVLLLFLSVTVVPQFAKIYTDFGLELPNVTLFTLQAAEALPKILVGVLVVWALVFLLGFSLIRSRFLHWIRTSIPLLGRTWVWSAQHEFATMMSTLSSEQLPLTDALTCTSESLRDKNLAWATGKVSERCFDGATLGQSLRESIHFDPTLTSLAEWGEANSSLPLAMRQAAETYEQELALFVQFLQRVLPPLMLTFVASTMFYMIASLMVPMVGLINGLTG